MPAIILPTTDTKKLIKPDRGDIFGNLWATKNIDLDRNPGKIRLADRCKTSYSNNNDADFSLPFAFARTNADQTERWWALTGRMFKTADTDPSGAFTEDAIVGGAGTDDDTPTDAQDNMTVFGQASGYDRLVVARATDIALLNNGVWKRTWWTGTLGKSALGSNNHYIYKFINLLLVPDGNVLHTIDDSLVIVTNRITLPSEYSIKWIRDDGNFAYIGTWNTRGGYGLVFPWNGTSQTYEEPISVENQYSFSGAVKDGILHIINGKGQLLRLNANAFEEVACFPFKDIPRLWDINIARNGVDPNGMTLVGGKINILANTGLGSQTIITENSLSGIWEYDEERGLYLKYTMSLNLYGANTDWGSGVMHKCGALVETNQQQGRFLAGVNLYSNTSYIVKKTINIGEGINSANNRGYFITSELQSDEFRAFWKRFKLLFRKFENSTDRIIIKYRMERNNNFGNEGRITGSDVQVTWSDDSTFVVASEPYSGLFANVSAGDEVEIKFGVGSGALAHISSISGSALPYTIIIDEAISGIVNTDTSEVRIQNWKKLGTISDQTINKQVYSIAKRSAWIQFKIELRGTETSPEIEKLVADFNYSKR